MTTYGTDVSGRVIAVVVVLGVLAVALVTGGR